MISGFCWWWSMGWHISATGETTEYGTIYIGSTQRWTLISNACWCMAIEGGDSCGAQRCSNSWPDVNYKHHYIYRRKYIGREWYNNFIYKYFSIIIFFAKIIIVILIEIETHPIQATIVWFFSTLSSYNIT